MAKPEFELKMQRIIKQSQQMYLTDAADRIAAVQHTIAEWRSGAIEPAVAAEAIHLQVHTMKGVALTIHFEPMHEICEELIRLLEEEDLASAEALIEQLPDKYAACQAIAGS